MSKRCSSSPDEFSIYLNEIGAIPLLTPEEEVALADRIREGDEEARNELVCRNLRLVVRIIRSYWGIALEDRVQEGNLGLMRAAEKFDPQLHGTKFDTYAAYWIRQSVGRGIKKQRRMVYIPPEAIARYRQWCKERRRLKEETGFSPTFEEVAAAMNVTQPHRLRELKEIVEGVSHMKTGVSLYRPFSKKDDRAFKDILPAADSRPDAPLLTEATSLHRAQLLMHVKHMINAIPHPDEREVLEHRYFSGSKEPISFTQLGEMHGGLRRQAMQQREGRALKTLRESIKNATEDALLAEIT